jgi:hypothetical protein
MRAASVGTRIARSAFMPPSDSHPLAAAPPSVVSLLIDQHRTLEGWLQRLANAGDADLRADLIVRVSDELTLHLAAEATVFYDALRTHPAERSLVESIDNQASLTAMLAEMLRMESSDARFAARSRALAAQALRHHVEEERHLFPLLRGTCDSRQLLRLTEQLRQQQEHLARRRSSASAAGMPRLFRGYEGSSGVCAEMSRSAVSVSAR